MCHCVSSHQCPTVVHNDRRQFLTQPGLNCGRQRMKVIVRLMRWLKCYHQWEHPKYIIVACANIMIRSSSSCVQLLGLWSVQTTVIQKNKNIFLLLFCAPTCFIFVRMTQTVHMRKCQDTDCSEHKLDYLNSAKEFTLHNPEGTIPSFNKNISLTSLQCCPKPPTIVENTNIK